MEIVEESRLEPRGAGDGQAALSRSFQAPGGSYEEGRQSTVNLRKVPESFPPSQTPHPNTPTPLGDLRPWSEVAAIPTPFGVSNFTVLLCG